MASARLCVTVTGSTVAELRARRDQVAGADLVELRLDTVSDPDAAAALAGRRGPVIVTCRPTWEGGYFTGSEEERRRILRDAQSLGADFVDVEWRAGFTDIIAARRGQGIVISSHDFAGFPSDLPDQAAAMRATGAEVVKLAVTAHRLTDCLALHDVARAADGPTVLIAMGDPGLATRVLASRFGSLWTYAGEVAEVGQVGAARLVEEFGLRRLTPTTALFGVVGKPVSHSLSPAMHNAAFRAAGLDAVYLPLAAADYDDFLAFAGAMALAGASVTAPFKLDAFERADEVDAVGRRIGSVNTLRRHGERWLACNTDVAGFLAPLQQQVDLAGTRLVILGAGGAARAAAAAAIAAGAKVSISARHVDRAAVVAGLSGASVSSWPPAAGSWDVLVNATPVGTYPDVDASPLPDGPFDGDLVYDLVYNPPRTRLLRDAEAAGCRILGGLEMLIAQARRQFEWWTAMPAPEQPMRAAALAALGEPEGSPLQRGAPAGPVAPVAPVAPEDAPVAPGDAPAAQ